jgi:Tol biopolymer transport system component
LIAPDGAVSDEFGVSVGISAGTIVIGADQADMPGRPQQGAVYVFVQNGASWVHQAKLTAAEGQSQDLFGLAAAIEGDTILIGAPTDGRMGIGAAYVFRRNGNVWAQQSRLVPGDGANDDNFGGSVAVRGDVIAIGSSGDDLGSQIDQGSVVRFVRDGNGWARTNKITAVDGSAGDAFGFSVAIDGSRIAVGVPFDDFNARIDQGSAYVYEFLPSGTQIVVNVRLIGNGTIIRNPNQPFYTNGQIVTLTAVPDNCYWRFSRWLDGDTNNPRTVTVGLSNCFTAIFTLSLPPATSENSKLAFISDREGNSDIYSMNSDGSNQTRLTASSGQNSAPAWSPDGSRIAFASDRDSNHEVYVMNADGTGQTRLTTNSVEDGDPAWSPDGSKITFFSGGDNAKALYVMNADGSNPVSLTPVLGSVGTPNWSPDGSKIVFRRSGTFCCNLWVINADGSNPQQLTTTDDGAPRWSPDGAKIAFHSDTNRNGGAQIFLMDANGSNPQQLTSTGSRNSSPAWSPDGSKIAFISNRDGSREIYMMNANGSQQTRITTNGFNNDGVDWSHAAMLMTPPPTLFCPTNVIAECAGTNGTSVSFNVTAVDACGTNLVATCVPPAGSAFAFGTTTVMCSTVDARNMSNGCTFTVTVRDTTPPVIACPACTEFAWAVRAGGSGDDSAFGVSVNSAGDSWIVGQFEGVANFGATNITSAGSKDVFVARYDTHGTLRWVRRAGGTGNDAGNAVAVDVGGNCYVTGYFSGNADFSGTNLTSSANTDIFVAKYDSNGALMWVVQAGGNEDDVGNSIATDHSGNCYVTGRFGGDANFSGITLTHRGGNDIFVVKYTSSGQLLWVRQEGGSVFDDVGQGIAVDAAGSCFVTGGFYDSATFGNVFVNGQGLSDFFLLKYDTDGTLQWVRTGGGTNFDGGNAVALDAAGNAYVTGAFSGATVFAGTNLSGSNTHFSVGNFDSFGTLKWIPQSGPNIDYQGFGIATDAVGRSRITGRFAGTLPLGSATLTSEGSDLLVAALDANGSILWAKIAGGPSDEAGFGVGIDGAGNTFVAGAFHSASVAFGGSILTNAGDSDVFVTKLSPAPIPYCPSNRTVVAGSSCTALLPDLTVGVSAVDACNGSVPVTQSPAPGTLVGLGAHAVTLTAMDGAGNSSSCVATVTVVNPPPVELKTFVVGNGIVTINPSQTSYTNCQTVTLTAISNSCSWAFSHWSDGVLTYSGQTLIISIGPTNRYTAYFTNLVPNCGGPDMTVCVNGQTGEGFYVTNNAEICLKTTLTNAILRYTKDCSEPVSTSTASSNCFILFYEGVFPAPQTVVIRAAAFSPSGQLLAQQACPVTIVITNECPGFFTLAASERGGTGGIIAGGAVEIKPLHTPYPCGTIVQLKALRSIGWKFLGWLGDASGTNEMTTVTMFGNRCVEAVFGTQLTITSAGHGTVIQSPESACYPYDTPVHLTAVPEPGYFFAYWTNGSTGTVNPLTYRVITDNRTVTAVFAPVPTNRYSLVALTDGLGSVRTRAAGASSFSTSNLYSTDILVTNTATPEMGQLFLGWSGDTGSASTNTPVLVVTMNTNRVITAHFTKRPRVDIVKCQGQIATDGVLIQVMGEFGERYVIQGSEDLSTWTNIVTVSVPFGIAQHFDTFLPTRFYRFYRAFTPP